MDLEKYILGEQAKHVYREKTFQGSDEEYVAVLQNSSTLYITNIKYDIEEVRLWHLFGMAGEVRRVIMGINSNKLTPCGFAFVEYYNKEDAETAREFLKGFMLDGKPLAIDKDMGFVEGRQFGRGIFGNKMKRDNYERQKRSYRGYNSYDNDGKRFRGVNRFDDSN
ncbi:nuclear cap-binding protein subunit 2 [Enteropsectra breve]|nr:nuclear cap-binding protein subunit 2 [Enteropsectra breve]